MSIRKSRAIVLGLVSLVQTEGLAQTGLSYVGAAGGAWHVATNWQPQIIPDNNFPTTYYTAAMDRPVVLNGTQIDIAGIINSSALDVFSSFDFRAGDNMPFLLNTGTLSIIPTVPPAGNSAFMGIPAGQTLTVSGGGTVRLGGDGLARILNSGTLNNQDNTIRGEGTIGEGGLTIINNGVIAANEASAGVAGTLTVFPGAGGVRNSNTLQARNLGILSLRGVYNNAGGTIVADAGGTVSLNLSEITGGTISSAATGLVLVTNNDEWISLTHTGRTQVNDDLTIIGVINNTGSITVNGSLRVNTEATLAGNGTIILNNSVINRVGADAATLTTTNYIRGRGQINVSSNVINDTGGIIRADGGVLLVDTGTGFFNNGTLLADGGTLSLFGGDFFNGSGTIHAANNSNVRLNSSKIIGGSITSAGNGSISIGVNLANLENVSRIDGRIVTQSGGALQIKGTIGSTGNGTLDMIGGATLRILETGTLSIGRNNLNGGQIIPAPGGGFGPEGGVQFFNNGTIAGWGSIGQNGMQIVNNGVIQGNGGGVGQSNQLTIDPDAQGLTNAGIIEAVDLGIVILNGGTGAFTQTGMAVIRATDPGSNLQIISNAVITGGIIGAGGGTVLTGGVTLESLTTDANIFQSTPSTMTINMNVINTGSITTRSGASLVVAGGSTLNSASGYHGNVGSIVISGNGNGDFDFIENGSLTSGVINVMPNGQMKAYSIKQGTLTIQNNAFGTIKSSFAPSVDGSLVGTLNIGSMGAALDITNRGMAVDHFGPSIAPTIAAWITSGYTGGAWNGFGIRSSSAAANPGFGVGYADASAIGSPPTFLGRPIDASTVLFRYTLLGDANLSGNVDIGDFALLAANFNTPGPWVEGDFNYNQFNDIADFALLAANFNRSLPADVPRGSIPESALRRLRFRGDSGTDPW